MKNQGRGWMMIGLIAFSAWMPACSDDSNDNGSNVAPIGSERSFPLAAQGGSGVSGTIRFHKISSDSTLATIQLTGTVAGDSHPADIYTNSVAEGGSIVLAFNPVNGATGESVTTILHLSSGTAITYEQLIKFDGHVNVHKSATELTVMIAQGNIGTNVSGGPGGGY